MSFDLDSILHSTGHAEIVFTMVFKCRKNIERGRSTELFCSHAGNICSVERFCQRPICRAPACLEVEDDYFSNYQI